MDTFNSKNLITLLLFFVLQGLIYCACLVKLAEIRRQKVPARVQLNCWKTRNICLTPAFTLASPARLSA